MKDAERRRDKYWYLPVIKKYLTYLFTYNSSAKNLVMDCQGTLEVSSQVRYEMQQASADSNSEQSSSAGSEQIERSGFWSYIVPAAGSGQSGGVLPAAAAPPPQPTRHVGRF